MHTFSFSILVPKKLKPNYNKQMPLSLLELTPLISNMELTYKGPEASK